MKENFQHTFTLLLNYLKRDWKKIVIWIILLAGFAGGFVSAFEEIGKGGGAAGLYETLKNPAMIAMIGPLPVDNAADYTIPTMYTSEMLLFTALIAMIVSAMHVVSHTRKEENLGLLELISSFKVGRLANSTAVILEVVIINVIFIIATIALMLSFNAEGFTFDGCLNYACALGFSGILGGVIALVFAQLMPTSTSANGAGIGLIVFLYLLRGYTDISNADLSKFNPLSWSYLSVPYVKNDYTYIVLMFLLSIVLLIVAFVLESSRDAQASYVPEREGKKDASKLLLSIPGVTFRLDRGIIIGAILSFFILGATYGSIYGNMQDFVGSNPLIKEMFTQSGISAEITFTATIMSVLAGIVGILPVALISKMYGEEKHGRMGVVYATKTSRANVYFTKIIMVVIFSFIGLCATAYGLGQTGIISMNNQSVMSLSDFMKAGLNYFPMIIFYIGLSGFLVGVAPRLVKVVYIYIMYCFMVGYFGDLLKIPDFLKHLSVQDYISSMPVDKFDLNSTLLISAIGIVLILIGYIAYRKRDIQEA